MKIPLILFSLLLTNSVFASLLDDWTDDQICGWMENPTPPEYIIDEAVKRNLDCAPESAKKKAQEDTGLQIMIYDADFSDSDKASLSSNDLNKNRQSDEGIYNVEQVTKIFETTIEPTSDDDPTVSKVIEVIQGDRFIVNIAESHELAGSNIKLLLRDIDAPDTIKSCLKQMEFGTKVKDFVAQKLADATSIKLKNFKKNYKGVLAQVIVDGKDLGEELLARGFASNIYGYWTAYFCSALKANELGNRKYWDEPFNPEKSIFWYERAIILNPVSVRNAKGFFRLSELYLNLEGTNDNIEKSLDFLKQSASLGFMEAEEELGNLLLYGHNYGGINIPINTIEAKKLLKKAHNHGSKRAEQIYCDSLPEDKQKTCKF